MLRLSAAAEHTPVETMSASPSYSKQSKSPSGRLHSTRTLVSVFTYARHASIGDCRVVSGPEAKKPLVGSA